MNTSRHAHGHDSEVRSHRTQYPRTLRYGIPAEGSGELPIGAALERTPGDDPRDAEIEELRARVRRLEAEVDTERMLVASANRAVNEALRQERLARHALEAERKARAASSPGSEPSGAVVRGGLAADLHGALSAAAQTIQGLEEDVRVAHEHIAALRAASNERDGELEALRAMMRGVVVADADTLAPARPLPGRKRG